MLKQFKHLGLVLEEVAVYRWGTHFVSTSMDRELSAHWVYFLTFYLQNSSSECYLHPGSWGGEVVDIGAISFENDHMLIFLLILLPIINPHNHFLKSWRNKWRWHFKHTNCAYRRYLKGHSCKNMPPLVEKKCSIRIQDQTHWMSNTGHCTTPQASSAKGRNTRDSGVIIWMKVTLPDCSSCHTSNFRIQTAVSFESLRLRSRGMKSCFLRIESLFP